MIQALIPIEGDRVKEHMQCAGLERRYIRRVRCSRFWVREVRVFLEGVRGVGGLDVRIDIGIWGMGEVGGVKAVGGYEAACAVL